jgi:hypothetical protein
MSRSKLLMVRLALFGASTGLAFSPIAVTAAPSADAGTSPVRQSASATTAPMTLAQQADERPMHAGNPGNQGLDMRDDGYNSQYLFGMTRGVAGSAVTPAVKPLLFLFTVPLDIVLLPFAAIGGCF